MPAARLTDMHICPMITGLVPHVGGPVIGPGCPTVLIGGMPAAIVGDMCTCVGPPDSIIMGSAGVLIGGKPAARMLDSTVHGGMIALGMFTVLIGDTGAGSSPAGTNASAAGEPSQDLMATLGANRMKDLVNAQALKEAAKNGEQYAERSDKNNFTAQFTLLDEAGKAMPGVGYEIETYDGQKREGKTDSSGKTQTLSGYTTADCRVTFFKEK